MKLPSARKAYHEACEKGETHTAHKRKWSHPIVFHAGKEAGWHELREIIEPLMWPRFKKIYEKLVATVESGETFEIPNK